MTSFLVNSLGIFIVFFLKQKYLNKKAWDHRRHRALTAAFELTALAQPPMAGGFSSQGRGPLRRRRRLGASRASRESMRVQGAQETPGLPGTLLWDLFQGDDVNVRGLRRLQGKGYTARG